MQTGWERWLIAGPALVLILGLPFLGVILAGRPPGPYLEFPPMTRVVAHEPFSWPAFGVLALLIVASVGPFVRRIIASHRTPTSSRLGAYVSPLALHDQRVFPWWGWLGLAAAIAAWLLAWTRFEWMRPFQSFTFTPLWLSYIVVVNALTFRRAGRCMMLHRPRYFVSLFPLSAVFWWTFEYLNRFVQNWFYSGGGELSAWEYIVQATVPFSTVLSAVLGTAELLSTYPRLSAGLEDFAKTDAIHARRWGLILMGLSTIGLLGMGLWPNYLFPMVWVAPVASITALQCIRGGATIFSDTQHGDWRAVWVVALAALVCGCFWELWNFRSLSHWEYAVPFVHRFNIFEMPLLGYAGYLPFGLECLAVADLVLARKFGGGVAYYREAPEETDFAQRKPTVAAR